MVGMQAIRGFGGSWDRLSDEEKKVYKTKAEADANRRVRCFVQASAAVPRLFAAGVDARDVWREQFGAQPGPARVMRAYMQCTVPQRMLLTTALGYGAQWLSLPSVFLAQHGLVA